MEPAALGRLLLIIALSSSGLVAAVSPRSSTVTAFRNVVVVPMDSERVVPHQTVVVRDARIVSIGRADLAVPEGAIVIDGAGQYLMPGLADMHIHLPDDGAPAGRAENELFLYLANGVTTVRSMKGAPSHLALRDRVRRGDLLGPTLYVAGPGLDGQRVTSPSDGEREVRAQKAAGYDLLKILPGLSLASYDAIADTAQSLGIPFAGHIPTDVGVRHAIARRQQTIEHLDGYLDMLGFTPALSIDKMLPIAEETKRADVWNVPTMAVMEANLGLFDTNVLLGRPELEYISRSYIDEWIALRARAHISKQTAETVQANRMRLLKVLHDVGAPLMLGTDSPQLFNAPGFSVAREMDRMVEAGLTGYEVLLTATRAVGEFLHDSCGIIRPGACADFVLVARNPLEGGFNGSHITGVMVRGHWLSRTDIQARLQQIHNLPDQYRGR